MESRGRDLDTAGRPAAPRLPYMPGVDGLRALAVAAVVAYHLGAGWLPGGYLGVDVFLVISGYLITSLLLAEHRQAGRIDLRRFWMRRARRLLPALGVLIVVVLAVMVLLHPGEVARLHGAVLASLGYVGNWYLVFADVPYFARFGRPSILQHLWSLAVEEQFYLLWPPILAAAILLGRRWLLAGIAAGIAASTALAWVLFAPDTDPSRIYYGSDARAVGLLAGAALAVLWPAERLRRVASSRPRPVLDLIGLAALAGVLAATLTLGDLDARLYQGGFLVVALATAVLVAAVAHPASRLGRALGLPALVWVGVRSYGIYLWHWPVLMLTRADRDVPLDGPALVVAQVALTVGMAALSYRYVEQPFRRGGLAGVRDGLRRRGRSVSSPARIAVASSASLGLVALGVAVAVVPGDAPSIPGLSDVASAAQPQLAGTRVGGTGEAAAGLWGRRSSPATGRGRGGRILAVGDSVMLGAAPALRRALGPRAVIDAAVSRQFSTGAGIVIAGLRALSPTTVVIHLGNNGYVPFDELEALMRRTRSVPRVVLVTVRVPLRWQDSVNDALRYAQSRYPNAVLADWRAASGGPGLLMDGAHVTPDGARVYARTIAAAVRAPAPGRG